MAETSTQSLSQMLNDITNQSALATHGHHTDPDAKKNDHQTELLMSRKTEHSPSDATLTLPPISNLFEVAGAASAIENPNGGYSFDRQTCSLPLSSADASYSLLSQLASTSSMPSYTDSELSQDLLIQRTIHLPPPSHMYGNDCNAPDHVLGEDGHYQRNEYASATYEQSQISYGLTPADFHPQMPFIYYGEPSFFFDNDNTSNVEHLQSPTLPAFQYSSSSLYNALGLNFQPVSDTPAPPPTSAPASSLKSKSKQDKVSKPMVNCHLCPKSFTAGGMSRHLAWHRRRGDSQLPAAFP
jgi:hypothetical protein